MSAKKVILLCAAAAALVAVFAVVIPHLARAGSSKTGDPGEKKTQIGESLPAGGEETAISPDGVGFVARYIRTNGYHEDVRYPAVKLIRSAEELNDYMTANETEYDLGAFQEAAGKYDETYFKDRILVLILLEEGSGSIRHRVAAVTWGDENRETLNVDVDVIDPGVGTCDMAEWHILIEPEAGVDVADESCVTVDLRRTAQEPRSGLVYCAGGGVSAALRIPEGWTAETERNENPDSEITYSIAFWPTGREGRVVLRCSRFLGVCGTGLKQKQVRLAGYEAWQGTYEGKRDWDFFTIRLGEGMEGIAIWNEGMSAWSKEERQEALEILETLEIGDGHPTEDQAVEIAKAAVTVPYDYTKALYNEQENTWTVAFGRRNYAGGGQLVTVNDAGQVVDSTWGE